MTVFRRHLRRLNAARAVAVSTLLVAAFTVELLFSPLKSLGLLYALAAAAYGTVLLYAFLDRWLGGKRTLAAFQVAGDTLLVAAFVGLTGGSLSPLSFLFALPVMVAGVLLGLRGGVAAGAGAWVLIGGFLAVDLWTLPPGTLGPPHALYSALSHLLGFLALGGLSGFLTDRLKLADTALEEHRDDLAALRILHAHIVQSISTGLMTTDQEGSVTFVNRAGSELLRRPHEEVIGRKAAALFGLPGGILGQAEQHLAQGRRYRFERPWLRPADGQEMQLGFTVSSLRDPDGRNEGWLLVFQDLTEIASLEEQVRTRERMAALGEMSAGMAHELRNPLAAISGSVQVLGQERVEKEEQKHLAEVVVRETARLNTIIRGFLQFARPGPFRARPVDLLALMEEMSRILRKSPDFSSRHQVEVVSGPGAGWGMADADRLRQVFWNLAGNALKAMPEGGKLLIQVSGHGGDQVMLSFKDEGHGMDEATVSRLFQPFHGQFREGAGLGAAIVYRIAQEHGGQVQVVSRPGRGTEIRFILQAVDPPASPAPGAAEEAALVQSP